jgi:hypothetical protein
MTKIAIAAIIMSAAFAMPAQSATPVDFCVAAGFVAQEAAKARDRGVSRSAALLTATSSHAVINELIEAAVNFAYDKDFYGWKTIRELVTDDCLSGFNS